MRAPIYPFTAVVGQDELKACLLYALVNPRVGGVLISGERGTGKSLLARSLADLLASPHDAGARRIVELPLGATEDMLLGALDIRAALTRGEKRLDAGLLQAADGNILYVDEVNLLGANIANALLEAAATGVARVEREGLSHLAAARFILIGTMNPREGRLRAQLLDRFGLCALANEETDVRRRADILERRMAFERDPAAMRRRFAPATAALAARVAAARQILANVTAGPLILRTAAAMAAAARPAGNRAEIALVEAARACAALAGRIEVTVNDLRAVMACALIHRADASEDEKPRPEKSQERPDADTPEKTVRSRPQPLAARDEREPEPTPVTEDAPDTEKAEALSRASGSGAGAGSTGRDEMQPPGELFVIKKWEDPGLLRRAAPLTGRRLKSRSGNRAGRYVSSRPQRDRHDTDIALDATFRAAALQQKSRGRATGALSLAPEDIRVKVREARTGGCILFVVDASASIGAHKRMYDVKAAIMSMLSVSYQKRDSIGLISFRKGQAELLLDITRSVYLAQKRLRDMPCGGNTPLAAGIDLACRTLTAHRLKYPDLPATMVLITDGRANYCDNYYANYYDDQAAHPAIDPVNPFTAPFTAPFAVPFAAACRAADRFARSGFGAIVLDTETGLVRFHLCEVLHRHLGGTLLALGDLAAEGIAAAVNAHKL